MGRVTYTLAQMWENGVSKGAGIFFWPAEGRKFFSALCIDTQNAQTFVENSNVG